LPNLDEFISAYQAGDLIFFTGAGASYESGAVLPADVLAKAAELFLPSGQAYSEDVRQVLEGKGVPTAPQAGIQPEIFYENLLLVTDDPSGLLLWRALSPEWLASQGERLEPNPNHLAIAAYAARHGLPVFTMNFDTLFETAAKQLGIEPKVVVVRAGNWVPPDERREPGVLRLFKLHGSIMTDGRESLDSLATTMQAISAVNQPMIAYLRKLASRRALAFVGYSGSDIDYYPPLAAEGLRISPFWFNPKRDPVAQAHADRVRARVLHELPAALFAQLEPPLGTTRPLDSADALARLGPTVTLRLTEPQKLYFLALCLHSIGGNEAAVRVLEELGPDHAGLPPRNRPGGLLLRARVEDSISAASAETALRAIAGARRAAVIEAAEYTALKARALYHLGMARHQQIGPSIHYGDPRVDWRPPPGSLMLALVRGTLLAIRLGWARKRLNRLARGASRVAFIRAEHAINDQRMVMAGSVQTILQSLGALRIAPLRILVERIMKSLLDVASITGDYFTYAHAQKYLNRLRGFSASADAIETYGLLRDPINYALVQRDRAVQSLQRGDRPRAACLFRLALEAALVSGSRATALKSLVGIAVAEGLTEADRQCLLSLRPYLEGAGYRRFWHQRVEPLLAHSG
jgi:hypothetical protein